ncbi:TolC family protein [Actibacterium sp. 188UL27-1]|uniref:TolC family protein n=1 Tax=Actibacterium sp. 188UL27-1 TaxID=2786961 RepID=UPI00195DDC91|nr:TolC family protein [Actibacterium sp. 188UL27-1]MBM7069749.1 TolC family protein [Actibacterium sp. 188UL27-1]
MSKKRLSLGLAALMLAGCAVKPDPITLEQHQRRIFDDVAKLNAVSVPLTTTLTLDEAVARGLLYNLDHKVQIMEEVLQGARLTVANIDMLPTLAANAGYEDRSSERATQSTTLFSRRTSVEPSFSEDAEIRDADLTFSWNVLDFGLSYFRAKQQADRALIAVEKRRRVMNNLSLQIETAYLEALTAQRLLPRVERLIRQADQAERRSAQIEREGLQSSVAALEYRRNLVQVVTSLKELKSSLAISKSRLASLMNLPAGTHFRLANHRQDRLPKLNVKLGELQNYGLLYRPEIREAAYQTRIDRESVNQEILNIFPELSIIASANSSSNKLLFDNEWRQAGLRATWNLINLVRGRKSVDAAKQQVKISDARRLALTAAILVQVSIGVTEYDQAVDSYGSALKLSNIEGRILRIASASAAEDEGTELDRIQRAAQAISAELNRDNAYVEARLALSRLLVSIGLDLLPPDAQFTDLARTKAIVGTAQAKINAGQLSSILNANAPKTILAAARQPKPRKARR